MLVIGLFAAGISTMVFVRNALISFQDQQLTSRAASSDLGTALIQVDIDPESGEVTGVRPRQSTASPDYFIALYDPDGEKVGSTGPNKNDPIWPDTFLLETTIIKDGTPFTIYDENGAEFRASAGVLDLGVGRYYTQVIALPISQIDRTVATFFGTFTVLALITILIGALSTRYLVTRTFRPLAQVESAAMSIAAGDFGQRLVPGDPQTEVGRLTSAINTMLDRVDTSISERDATVRKMRRFIGDASHELRTPLVTVRGYAELYRIGAIRGDEATGQAMERIEKEAVRMGAMVEDLLALARLDERREIALVPIDLRAIARDAAMDVRAASPQRVVTVRDETSAPAPTPPVTGAVTVDPGPLAGRRRPGTAMAGARSLLRRRPRTPGKPVTEPIAVPALDLSPVQIGPALSRPPVVLADEHRVRQVVANLLGNARRFSPEDSSIEITVGTDGERITEHAPIGMGWIAISDHGEGVPEQIRELIFERFWRADTSRARETGGSGLGLAIVASIVQTLHGDVSVEDTPGGGATFRISFPLAVESTLYLDTQPIPYLEQELRDTQPADPDDVAR